MVVTEQSLLHGGKFLMDTHTQLSFEIFRREIVSCNELKKFRKPRWRFLTLHAPAGNGFAVDKGREAYAVASEAISK